jgi:hypothetical protein
MGIAHAFSAFDLPNQTFLMVMAWVCAPLQKLANVAL